MDQVGDGADLDAVLAREHLQVGAAGHGAVVVHHFHDHRRRRVPGQARQVATGFGMAGAGEHAAVLGAQREDMTGLHDIGGACVELHSCCHRARTVSGGDAGGNAGGGFDGHGKRSTEHAAIAWHHLLQAQALAVFIGEG